MSSKLVTVTFNTHQSTAMVQFYNALGTNLQVQRVDKGGEVYRGVLGNLEVVLHTIQTQNEKQTPRVSLRFELDGIDQIWARIQALPNVDVMMDLENMPSGKSFIVIDPDGHSIEIFEKWPEDSQG